MSSIGVAARRQRPGGPHQRASWRRSPSWDPSPRFAGVTLRSVPSTIRLYPTEVLRQLKDIAWGSGAILVGGGTVGVMILLSISAGTSLGIEGFSGLELIGLAPLTGFVSASANTRELAPLVAALALGAQVGCRFTAQLGSMKIARGGRRPRGDGDQPDAVPGRHPRRRLHGRHPAALPDRAARLVRRLAGLGGDPVRSVAGAVRPLLLDVHPGPRRLLLGDQDLGLRPGHRADPLLVRHEGPRRPAVGGRGHRSRHPRQHRGRSWCST